MTSKPTAKVPRASLFETAALGAGAWATGGITGGGVAGETAGGGGETAGGGGETAGGGELGAGALDCGGTVKAGGAADGVGESVVDLAIVVPIKSAVSIIITAPG